VGGGQGFLRKAPKANLKQPGTSRAVSISMSYIRKSHGSRMNPNAIYPFTYLENYLFEFLSNLQLAMWNYGRFDWTQYMGRAIFHWLSMHWQEHQNFCNPFFDHFLRQHSPVPILIGFFKKRQEPEWRFQNWSLQFSQTGGSPRPLMSDCGKLVWRDLLYLWDQSTLEPLNFGRNGWALLP